jgi:hypothetical protein
MEDVLAKAKAADVVVLMLGLDIKVTSSEGTDRSHDQAGYALPGKQGDLVQAIAALNKPTVVIILSGMAVGMDYIGTRRDWPLLLPGYGGIFGPTAIAQALFGDYTPSGKLPYTIYPEAWAGATRCNSPSPHHLPTSPPSPHHLPTISPPSPHHLSTSPPPTSCAPTPLPSHHPLLLLPQLSQLSLPPILLHLSTAWLTGR